MREGAMGEDEKEEVEVEEEIEGVEIEKVE